jgi:hypothetical protein
VWTAFASFGAALIAIRLRRSDLGACLGRSEPHLRVTCLIEEVMPDKSSQAAGQVFETDRPHKSLHVLGRRLETKTMVTGLKAAQASDVPFKIGGQAKARRRVRFPSASATEMPL